MKQLIKFCLISVFISAFSGLTLSLSEEWVINDIRISGLQRVSAGSVFNVMPISVGDTVDEYDLQSTAKTIFKTGQFDDIQLGREANTLIISLVERPSIASIELDGNKALKTEDLLKGLDDAGLSEGQVFKRSIINSLAIAIQRQYVSQGRYGAKVDVSTEDEPRNRVSLFIDIDEELKTGNIMLAGTFNADTGLGVTFGIEDKNISKTIEEAKIIEESSNQILDFTREVKGLPEQDKIKIIEALWSIIYSNKDADIYETNLMRRLAGLLYIDNKTMGDIKEKIKQNLK